MGSEGYQHVRQSSFPKPDIHAFLLVLVADSTVLSSCRVVHEDDKDRLWGQTGISHSNIVTVSDMQRMEMGGTFFTFLHTPGTVTVL